MKAGKKPFLRVIAYALLVSMLFGLIGCGLTPAEPIEPTEPTEPAEPTAPTEPSVPTEPSAPSEPEDPTQSTVPEPTATEPPATEAPGVAKISGHKVTGSFSMSRVWDDGSDDVKVGPQLSHDGDAGTFWNPQVLSGYTGEPAITYELDKEYDLNKFVFTFSISVYFKLFVSADGETYTLAAQIDSDNSERAFNYGVCTLEGLQLQDVRYVKLVFTGNAAGNTWISFMEAEMTEDGQKDLDTSWMLPEEESEDEGGEEVITISKATIAEATLTGEYANDRSTVPSYGLLKSFDGDVNTAFNPCAKAGYTGAPGVIFKLDKVYDLDKLVFTFGANDIMYMDISVSADGTEYTSLISITKDDTSMYSGGVATIDASAANGVQYIKVIFNGRTPVNDWINFKELAVTARTVKKITMKVSGAFSSNMVLQREKPITIWGWGKTGAEVVGTFAGHTATAIIDENGKWELSFPKQAANAKPQTMTITGMGKTITFDNILIGDVYLVSGQSNAELSIGRTVAHLDSAAKQAVYELFRNDSNIRIFLQTKSVVLENANLWDAPQENVIDSKWKWKTASANDNFWNFSALGMYFAKTLRDNLDEDIPIGLIQMAAGGAYISELLPGELCARFEYNSKHTVTPGGYYNTMISPFVGLPISGMLYYQGESYDRLHVKTYADELTAFVTELRNRWGQDFNFYNVQLSSYGQMQVDQNIWKELPHIRNQQYKALSMLDNYYLTTAMDVGYRGEVDIGTNVADFAHPKDKKTLGERVALQALAVYYGKLAVGEQSFSPVPGDVQWTKDGIVITFQNAETLKLATGDALVGFQCVINAEVVNVTGRIINGNQVLLPVDATTVSQVRYAIFQLAYPENANLVNGCGLPAPAFTLDNPGDYTVDKIVIDDFDLPISGWAMVNAGATKPEDTYDGDVTTQWNAQMSSFAAKPEVTFYLNSKADLNSMKLTFGNRAMYFTVYLSKNDVDYTEAFTVNASNYTQFYEEYVCTISDLNAEGVSSIKIVFSGSTQNTLWMSFYEIELDAVQTKEKV